MNTLLTAVALAIALPGVAHAQVAPSEKPKMDCCEKTKEDCACCDKMAGNPANGSAAAWSDPHANHDMTQNAAPADGHAHH